MGWLGLGCAIVLLPGCNSAASRSAGSGGAGGGGWDGAAGGGDGGGAGGAGTGAAGSSGAIDTDGGGAVVACAVGQDCPPGRICVPDPRATCVTGTPCPNVYVCLSGSRLCLNVMLSDSGPTTECLPGQYVVTCRPISCEGSNECAACVDGTTAICGPATPCPAGHLCIPVRACANATDCGSVCVIP